MLGSALALKLLFGIPLAWEAIITGLDVMFTSALQHYGMRKLEAVLVLTIAFRLGRELVLVRPDRAEVAGGFVARLDTGNLYAAIGIVGAYPDAAQH